MANPEPPPATSLDKVPTMSFQALRDVVARRELVCDAIDSLLEELSRGRIFPS